MGGSAIRHLGVMVSTQDVRRSIQRMMTDPPATLGMAVHFSDSGVYTDSDRTDQGCLSKVRAETRPEVVKLVGAAMDYAGVKRNPVSKSSKQRNENCDNDDNEDEDQHNDEAVATTARCDLGRSRVCSILNWRARR
jgi:hypothetical protein